MHSAVLNDILKKYDYLLASAYHVPGEKISTDQEVQYDDQCAQHCRWMLEQIPSLESDKQMRWVCFVQGVLWALGYASVDELRVDNQALLEGTDG